jgi:hypothetical protein
MNRQVLSSGMIVCSALLICGWTQSSASDSHSDCVNQSVQKDSSNAPDKVGGAEKHCLKKTTIATSSSTPEHLLNLQWGNRGTDKLPNNMETVYSNLLKQAQTLASRDQLEQAIATTVGIPKNSQSYGAAQQLQEDWSRELLRRATVYCQQAQVKTALSILNAIPSTSQLSDRVAELRQRWGQQAVSLNQAIAAKEAGNWQEAIRAVDSLEGSLMYNSLPVQELLQQAVTSLYEPDRTMLQIATADLPSVQLPAAATTKSTSDMPIQ